MKISININLDIEESGLNEDEVKDHIIEFTRNLLINGADNEGIGLVLEEVSYFEN